MNFVFHLLVRNVSVGVSTAWNNGVNRQKPNYSIASEWLSHTKHTHTAHTHKTKVKQEIANSGTNHLANDWSTVQYDPSFEYPSFSLYGYLHPDEDPTKNSDFGSTVLPASTQGVQWST